MNSENIYSKLHSLLLGAEIQLLVGHHLALRNLVFFFTFRHFLLKMVNGMRLQRRGWFSMFFSYSSPLLLSFNKQLLVNEFSCFSDNPEAEATVIEGWFKVSSDDLSVRYKANLPCS